MHIKPIAAGFGLCLLLLAVFPFAQHAIGRGLQMNSVLEQASRLFHRGDNGSNIAIYGHMVLGGALSFLAPLQLIGPIRRRWPVAHRVLGYALIGLALVTGLGGCFYVLTQGTIGGLAMDLGFGFYGACMVLAAVQTLRAARARMPIHRVWATRLIILALGSWIYRVHYGIWTLATGGIGIRADFTGPFDLVQMVAFYAPYLLIYEVLRRRRPALHLA
ncbi:MAG: DUF2306 domain-containing protein [Sedimentitalea sp.]